MARLLSVRTLALVAIPLFFFLSASMMIWIKDSPATMSPVQVSSTLDSNQQNPAPNPEPRPFKPPRGAKQHTQPPHNTGVQKPKDAESPSTEQLSKPDPAPEQVPIKVQQDETKPPDVKTEVPIMEPVKNDQKNDPDREAELKNRRESVVEALKHAWSGYHKYCMGQDEFGARTKRCINDYGLGLTIVDALDTLYMTGLMEEFNAAKEWVKNKFNARIDRTVSFFETTIRVLGGLLSAYALSGDEIFKQRAIEIGDRLMPAFNNANGLPYSQVNLGNGQGNVVGWTGGNLILAEIGTVQMEFSYLSHISGNMDYATKALHVYEFMSTKNKPNGLYPIYVGAGDGSMSAHQTVSMGAMGDSWYEYLFKTWLLTGKTQPLLKKMYDETMVSVIHHLVKQSPTKNLTYVGELRGSSFAARMDHLACFAGGMFALSSLYTDDPETAREYLRIGEGIAETCYQMYAHQPSGISPESVVFTQGNELQGDTLYYILRPEALEALFVAYRLTHNPIYQDHAWKMFQAIQKHCRVDEGYVGLSDVTKPDPPKDDHMQSFFLAETLKYLYLIFSPDEALDLEKWVLNTEAHPLPVFHLELPHQQQAKQKAPEL